MAAHRFIDLKCAFSIMWVEKLNAKLICLESYIYALDYSPSFRPSSAELLCVTKVSHSFIRPWFCFHCTLLSGHDVIFLYIVRWLHVLPDLVAVIAKKYLLTVCSIGIARLSNLIVWQIASHHRENFILNCKCTQGLLYATQCGVLSAEGFELSKRRTFYQKHKKLLKWLKVLVHFFSSVALYPLNGSFTVCGFLYLEKSEWEITGLQSKMVRNASKNN